MTSERSGHSRASVWPRLILVLIVYAAIFAGGGTIGGWITMVFSDGAEADLSDMMYRVMLTGFVVYVLLTALPFVPGVEIGLAMIFMFGVDIVPIVYLATLLSLTLAFLIGRTVPDVVLKSAFGFLGLTRAQDLVGELMPLNQKDRTKFLIEKAPGDWVPWLLKYRLIALAVLINMPGSSLIGGGGGISMAVGISRLVSLPRFVLTVAIAVSPLPILIMMGSEFGLTIWGFISS